MLQPNFTEVNPQPGYFHTNSLAPAVLDSLEQIAASLTSYSSGIAKTILEGYGYQFGLTDCATLAAQQQSLVSNPPVHPPSAVASDAQSATLQVFPNPADSEVRFQFRNLQDDEAQYQLIIYDLWGRAVYQNTFSGDGHQLRWDCSRVVKGMYLYRVFDPLGNQFSGSVIVQ